MSTYDLEHATGHTHGRFGTCSSCGENATEYRDGCWYHDNNQPCPDRLYTNTARFVPA